MQAARSRLAVREARLAAHIGLLPLTAARPSHPTQRRSEPATPVPRPRGRRRGRAHRPRRAEAARRPCSARSTRRRRRRVGGAGQGARRRRALLELRDDVAVAKPEDLPALFEQMHHLGALRAQRGRSVSGSVDRASPYFGHMRLEETVRPRAARPGAAKRPGGGATCSSARARTSTRRAGIRIVDWRHAPVSRIYYRYGEGDDYEEELGDRVVEGVVARAARREHRRRASSCASRRRRARSSRGKDGRWRARERASRAPRDRDEVGGAAGRRRAGAARASAPTAQMRQDKHLPAIAAHARRAAVRSHRAGQRGPGRHPGQRGQRQDDRRPAPRRVPRVPRAAALPAREDVRRRPERGARPLRGARAAVARRRGRAGRRRSRGSPSRLVAQLFPRLPTQRQRRDAAGRGARQVAPGDAAGDRRASWRASASAIDARMRDGDGASGRRPTGARAALGRDGERGGERRPTSRVSLLCASGSRASGTLPGVAVRRRLPEVTRSALEQLVHRAAPAIARRARASGTSS